MSTHKGLFKFTRLPFGLSSSVGIFQRYMESLLNIDGVICYLDDILIMANSEEEHDRKLKKVLAILKDNNVVINEKKSVFKSDSVEYLGNLLTREGLKPSPDKIKDIQDCPIPNTVNALKSFFRSLYFLF